MKNQNKINKILIIAIIMLVAFIGYRTYTEQKRVEYYICYEQYDTGYSMNAEETKEFCHIKVYERND